MKNFTLKIIALFLLCGYILSNAGCDLVEKLEPKDFVEVFENKIINKDWIVDSIKYTRTSEIGAFIYDSVKTVGKMRFKKHEDVANVVGIGPTQGLMFHTYLKDGITKTDTNAWNPHNSGTTIPYFDISYVSVFPYINYELGYKVIYDIKEVSDNKFHLVRYERIQYNNGQYDGYLRSVIKMHN